MKFFKRRTPRTFLLEPLRDEQYARLLDREYTDTPILLADWGYEIVPHIPKLGAPIEVTTESLSVADLGCSPNAPWTTIVRAASRFNLTLLPVAYIVPLRFAYHDQREGVFERVAHTPIIGRDAKSYRLCLYRNERLTLHARAFGAPESVWPPSCVFVFMQTP